MTTTTKRTTVADLMACEMREFEAAELLAWMDECRALSERENGSWANFDHRYIIFAGAKTHPTPQAKGWAAMFADLLLDALNTSGQAIALRKLFATHVGQAWVTDHDE